jgi:hypothetical protein
MATEIPWPVAGLGSDESPEACGVFGTDAKTNRLLEMQSSGYVQMESTTNGQQHSRGED